MAPDYFHPGVYIKETGLGVRPISGVPTSAAAFVDVFPEGPIAEAVSVTDLGGFEKVFGASAGSPSALGLRQFFLNGGATAWVVRVDGSGPPLVPRLIDQVTAGTSALDSIDRGGLNLLCLPALAESDMGNDRIDVLSAAAAYCLERGAFLIIDPPLDATTPTACVAFANDLAQLGNARSNAALNWPPLMIPGPAGGGEPGTVAPSGTVAGIYARTDRKRGVWKAPAGVEASLVGAEPAVAATEADTDALSVEGINVIRSFPGRESLVWGARTLHGVEALQSTWKYVPTRRLAILLEESIDEGTKWAVFEPNDQELWGQLRASGAAFLTSLFRAGAFAGEKPEHAFFVRCDRTTTTPADIALGIANLVVGFAPLKPVEFITLEIPIRTAS